MAFPSNLVFLMSQTEGELSFVLHST